MLAFSEDGHADPRIHHGPSMTREKYEEVVRRLTGGQSRLESPSDVGVAGLLGSCRRRRERIWVFDVFESQEAADQFRATVAPIAQEVGIEEPVTTYPTHTFICA